MNKHNEYYNTLIMLARQKKVTEDNVIDVLKHLFGQKIFKALRDYSVISLRIRFPSIPTKKIAEKYGISQLTVAKILKKAGLPKRKSNLLKRKTKRAKRRRTFTKVVGLRNKYPFFTLYEISKRCGVTKQYVRQILKKAGLPTKAERVCWFCYKCRNPFPLNKLRIANVNKVPLYTCPECWENKKKKIWTTLVCSECSGTFDRYSFIVKRNLANGGKFNK